MLDSVTKFLEKVDQRANEIASQREQLAAANAAGRTLDFEGGAPVSGDMGALPAIASSTHVSPGYGESGGSGSTDGGGVSGGGASGAARAPSGVAALAPLPSVAASDERTRMLEGQLQQRDQALLRIQRDYEELAMRTREVARELERKAAEADDAAAGRKRVDAELEALKEQRTQGESGASELRDEVAALQAAVADANAQAESYRGEMDIAVAQKRSYEGQLQAAKTEVAEARHRSAAALSEKDRELAALRDQLSHLRAAGGGGGLQQGSGTGLDGAAAGQGSTLSSAQRVSQLEGRVAEAEGQLTAVRGELTEAKTANDRLRREVATARKAADDAAEQARVAQSMYDGELASHQSTRSRLDGALRDAKEECQILQRQLNAARHASSSPTSADGAGSGGPGDGKSSGGGEWERRAKELAELVVEKQAALEARRSEADQWKARYESAQQRIREMELVSLSSTPSGGGGVGHRSVHISGSASGDPSKDHAEALMGEFGRSQFFGNLSRRGKIGAQITTAAQHIDGLSLHAGKVLRRSSVLRVMAIMYVIVLQLWAFFAVSLTAVPPAAADQLPPH
jgi:DNA repair exonuclease SbcCD ATPase subunit